MMNIRRCMSTISSGRFLSMQDVTGLELKELLQSSLDMKRNDKKITSSFCQDQVLAMIFQKRSTRTRISSQVGMMKLGGNSLFLSSEDIQLGVNESLHDTAKVLSRFVDIVLARVYSHADITAWSKHSDIPVINGLSDLHHPLQALADYMTLQESFGKLDGMKLAWVGDGNNIIHDLMLAAPHLGVHVSIATPVGYEVNPTIAATALQLAKSCGTKITFTNDPIAAVRDANVIATDTWISMGQEEDKIRRLNDFKGFQVTTSMLSKANSDWRFLHCLPRHKEEVEDDVFYSQKSLVFDEAENRMWTTMSVIKALLKE